MFDGTRSNELSPSPLLHRPWSVLQISKTHPRQNGTLRICKIHTGKFLSRCNPQSCHGGVETLGGLGLCHSLCHARSPRIATNVAAASLQQHKPLTSGTAPRLFDAIPAMTPSLDVFISHPPSFKLVGGPTEQTFSKSADGFRPCWRENLPCGSRGLRS